MDTETQVQPKWTAFEIMHEHKEGTTSSSYHAFVPEETKNWLIPDFKAAGFDGTYEGNKSLCGKFKLFNGDERVEEFSELEGVAFDGIPKQYKVCGHCIKSYNSKFKTT